jgi:hypothetical protein
MGRITRWMAAVSAAIMLASPSAAAAQTLPSAVIGAWIVNAAGATSPVFHASVDVQSAELVSRAGDRFVEVKSTGIPGYATTITPDVLAGLAERAKTDFRSGSPTVSVGQVVSFGEDVGYATNRCDGQPGYGYWPAGPGCATVQQHDMLFPLNPQIAASPRTTGMGEIGLWVNGAGIFNWSDAQSYRSQGVWQQTAAMFEGKDMDVCGGHSANGDYHMHFYSPCLAQQLNDDGSGHSPIYGFASDGIPIYGPWTGPGQLAHSGWKIRDFETADSPTGCGGGGQRTCLMVDPTDPGKGVTPASQPGPSTRSIVPILMGRNLQAVAGAYAQDYYYDRGCADCLDEHNGHDDGDGLGYHYALTAERAPDGSLSPVFPYILGLTYAGVPATSGQRLSPGGGPPAGQGGGPSGAGAPGPRQGGGVAAGAYIPGSGPDDPRRR